MAKIYTITVSRYRVYNVQLAGLGISHQLSDLYYLAEFLLNLWCKKVSFGTTEISATIDAGI